MGVRPFPTWVERGVDKGSMVAGAIPVAGQRDQCGLVARSGGGGRVSCWHVLEW